MVLEEKIFWSNTLVAEYKKSNDGELYWRPLYELEKSIPLPSLA